jgi:transcriptional regulator with XRE-family HTH domain
MTIGQRAAKLVKERAWKRGTTFGVECDLLGVWDSQLRNWANGKGNPSARVLAEMHEQGYDVIWILTGKESNHGKT